MLNYGFVIMNYYVGNLQKKNFNGNLPYFWSSKIHFELDTYFKLYLFPKKRIEEDTLQGEINA